MVYLNSHHPSIVELARAGNIQAIAHWVNQAMMPYGIRAYVGGGKPGCLKILVEFQLSPKRVESSDLWRNHLIRFICHRIWKLNSARIEGVRIAARYFDDSTILWEQSVKVVSPARRLKKQHSSHLRAQIQQTVRHKAQLKVARSLLMSGPLLFAFVFGGVLGFNKAPVEQTNAAASSKSDTEASPPPTPLRPDMVQTALETVPVVKHNQIADPTDPSVSLMFAGDVTLTESFTDEMGKDYERTFADMNEYRLADLAMVNLENPMTRSDTPLAGKQFNFKADPDAVKVLTDGGVDLVNLANNHTMDYEEPGLLETLDTLKQAGVEHVGAGRDVKEARRPKIIDVKGQRVAYLGYYGADFEIAGDRTPGTNYAEEQRIAQDIKAIRSQVDWIVVNYHWGEELATRPADWQVNLAHFTIDQGADVVVGHHPHVLQGAEVYRGRPIAYSLGNFIFGGNSRSNYDTAVLKVALKDKQMKVEFLPVQVQRYQPKVVSGDKGAEILQSIDDLSSGFQQPLRSPMILDARVLPPAPPTPIATPSSPAETVLPAPTSDLAPVQPSPSPSDSAPTPPTTDTVPVPPDADPMAPLGVPANPTDAATPSDPPDAAPVAPSPDTLPSGESTEPSPTPSPASGSPTDSFIDSPNQTPLNSTEPTTSGEPAPVEQDNSLNYQGAIPLNHPVQISSKPSASRQTATQVKPDPTDWVASEQVGAALIPDVSLLAAAMW